MSWHWMGGSIPSYDYVGESIGRFAWSDVREEVPGEPPCQSHEDHADCVRHELVLIYGSCSGRQAEFWVEVASQTPQRRLTEYNRQAAMLRELEIAIPQHGYVLASHTRFNPSYYYVAKSIGRFAWSEVNAEVIVKLPRQ